MAAPQVAGLATYLWTLRPDLKSNEVAERIRKHARPVPTSVCATDTSSTPVIDAYATILSADVSLVDAPARTAILDVVGVDGVSEPDGDFTYADFKKYIDEFTSSVSSPEFAEYSRFDLNGDGYTGGSKLSYFNLNMDVKDNASVYGVVEAGDGSAKRWFDESALTDLDILCYYAYLILPTEDQADIESACMPKPEILIETGVDSAGPEFLPFYYVSTVAINDRGVVAFNGFDAKANSGGFVTSAPHIARQVGPTGTPSNNPFSIFDINSAAVADVVSVQMIYSTGDILLQRWKEDGIGQPSLISRSAFPVAVVNDNGLVAFQGFYNGKSALIAGAGIADLISLRTFDDNFFELVLDIANTGDIVYRDHTNNIVVQKYPSTSVDTLTNVAYLDIKQSPPGISGDGKLVVFAGADSAGPGIFVVERAPVRKTFKIVDTHGDPLSAGGKFTALAEINGSFGRVAISTTAQTNGETRVTVVFTGQRTISELANDVDGIFRVTGMLSADGEALTLGVPIKVLQYDDKLSNEKYVRHFDFSLSQSGEYIGIWVSFADGSQAVVRAE